MKRRGLGVLIIVTISSFAVAQDAVSKNRFADLARNCGVDPNSKPRFFYRPFDPVNSNWTEVCNSDAADHEGAWDDAQVWSSNRQAKLASVIRSSQSGDWSFANYYCFRPNGSVKRIVSTYSTSNAEVAFEYVRDLDLDEDGRVIHKPGVAFYRMGTAELIAKPPELHSIHDFARSVPVYRNISELPMAEALKKPSSCGAK